MSTSKQVVIHQVETEVVPVKIVGTSPLIVHAWSQKALRMMLDKQTGRAKKQKHDIKVPVNDFIESLYWLTDKPELGKDDEEAEANFAAAVEEGARWGFPVTGIKQSFVMGSVRCGMDVKGTELRGAFFLRGATDASTRELAEIVGPTPVMREDLVRLAGPSRAADIRYRAQFDEWEIPLLLEYNRNGKYSLEQILQIVNAGGFTCGIGEWRPEKDGQNGMYRIATD